VQFGGERTYHQVFTYTGVYGGVSYVSHPLIVVGFPDAATGNKDYGVLSVHKTSTFVDINGDKGNPLPCGGAVSSAKRLLVISLLASCSTVFAEERCDAVIGSDLIVQGKLRSYELRSIVDGGFTITGTINARHVLLGTLAGHSVSYSFYCRGCPRPASDDLDRLVAEEGVWLLKRSERRWRSAGRSSGDPGWRTLDQLETIRKCLKDWGLP